MFGEDLNTLEVFAYAHNKVQKLSGQLLFDTASRLLNLLKRRYLDYLDKRNLNMSEPGFESLREFVVHEIKMMTSECAQAFFKQDEKDGSRETSTGSKDCRVREVVVGMKNDSRGENSCGVYSCVPGTGCGPDGSGEGTRGRTDRSKLPPVCFVCDNSSTISTI